ncbi:MAG: helix-turn-helix domain-containing protein [Acidobacteriota bacterium]|nr:MAG: helix-turn-helix domain-containing protein [Acidobacteriota bacterium]
MSDLSVQVRRHVGQHLRRTRHALGWTLEDVTTRLAHDGVRLSRSTLHRIETGRTVLALETVSALCRVMGVPFGYLEEIVRSAAAQREIDLTGYRFEELIAQGHALGARGRVALALQHFEAAHDWVLLQEQLDDRDDSLATALVHMADCQRRLRHFALSQEAATRALNLDGCSPENRLRAVLLNVSIGYMTRDFYRAALFAEHAERELPHASEPVQAFGYYVTGNLHYLQERYREAIVRFRRAERLYRRLDAPLQLSRLYVTMGHALARSEDGNGGASLIHDGYRMARKNRFHEVELYGLRILGLVDAERDDPDSALFHFEHAARLARRLGLTHELFLAWHGIWTVSRRHQDRDRERHARRALKRLLKKINPELREAEQFVTTLALEDRGSKP